MVFKTKMVLLCSLIGGLGIIEARCVAMQRRYRSATPQEAERRKRYWLDQFNVRKDDKQWLQKFRNIIIEYKFATAAELDALTGVKSASSTADAPSAATQPVQPVEQHAATNTFNLAELHRQAQLQRKNQRDSARAQEPKAVKDSQLTEAPQQSSTTAQASSTAQNASDSSGTNSDSASQMLSQMQEINAARAARYAKNLLDSFKQAKEDGNLVWLKEHREQLVKINQSLQEEIDDFIQALALSHELAPQQTPAHNNGSDVSSQEQERHVSPELDPSEQRKLDRSNREKAVQEMRDAHTEQEAAAALVQLYKSLTATHAPNYQQYYDLLDQLPLKSTLTELNAELTGLAAVPEINALIENEIKMLQGHMLYRLWEHPSQITPDVAFDAFQDAAEKNDHNAMINLYKTYLLNSDYNESVIAFIVKKFSESIEHNDATAIFDLYHHFLKESSGKDLALANLYDHIKQGKAPAEIWGIIALCFVGTSYSDDILPMIARQFRCNVPIFKEEFTEELINQYDEYRAAIINGELDTVLNLGHHLLECHIIDRETFSGIITSITQQQQQQPSSTANSQEISPEDAAAIQLALEQHE